MGHVSWLVKQARDANHMALSAKRGMKDYWYYRGMRQAYMHAACAARYAPL